MRLIKHPEAQTIIRIGVILKDSPNEAKHFLLSQINNLRQVGDKPNRYQAQKGYRRISEVCRPNNIKAIALILRYAALPQVASQYRSIQHPI